LIFELVFIPVVIDVLCRFVAGSIVLCVVVVFGIMVVVFGISVVVLVNVVVVFGIVVVDV